MTSLSRPAMLAQSQSDFMYTLFVPARAHLAFPARPAELKAFRTRAQPSERMAGRLQWRRNVPTRPRAIGYEFAIRKPSPSRLISRVRGRQFQIETAERNGRWYRMFIERRSKKGRAKQGSRVPISRVVLDWLENTLQFLSLRESRFSSLFPHFSRRHGTSGSISTTLPPFYSMSRQPENQMLNRASNHRA